MNSSPRALSALVFCLVVPPLLCSQSLPRPFTDSTVFISYKVDAQTTCTGSGFIIGHGPNETINTIYLVTNKHVLPLENGPREITIRVNVISEAGGSTQVKEVIIPVRGDDHKFLPTVKLHPTPSTDVAVVDITKEARANHLTVTGGVLSDSWLMSREDLKTSGVTLGYEIYLLGYPASMYDPSNTAPLLRMGIIASDPVAGYSFNQRLQTTFNFPAHIDGFLIDANVFPGSSGSMVVLRPGIVYKDGWPTFGGTASQPRIIGIVSKSIPITDTALQITTRMAVGIAFSSESIRETLTMFQ